MKVAVVAGLFVALCVATEVAVLRMRRLSPEFARKIVHMSSAVAVAFLPLVVSFNEIAVLGIVFALIMAISQHLEIFTAIHGVSRETYGEVLFPLGIAVGAVLCPSPRPFAYGVLVLGLGDGLAALVGERVGGRIIPFVRTRKTIAGTGAFVVACFALGLVLIEPTGVSPAYVLAAAAIMAVALAPIELFLTYGVDNLALPPVAGLLLTAL